ncbi:MAG: type II toxin-antitoxin system MazE family antitoxin [Waterburya sp.]
MTQKISITLEEEVLAFIDSQTNNRSQLINEVFRNLKKQQALKELEAAYIEQSQDEDEIAEIKLWDVTVGDGIGEDTDED